VANSTNKDSTIESVIRRKSIRLIQARFLERTGRIKEAEVAYRETAQDEELIVKELKKTGYAIREVVVNSISAASCWKKCGNYDRAFELLDEVLQATDLEPKLRNEALRLSKEWRASLLVYADEKSSPRRRRESRKVATPRKPSLVRPVPEYPSEAQFQTLLGWLDQERNKAWAKFEAIRQRVTNLFMRRGFSNAEDMADEVVIRVSRRLPMITQTYRDNPAQYFYGVAKLLLLESEREQTWLVPLEEVSNKLLRLDEPSEPEIDLQKLKCLNRCMGHLESKKRDLLLAYYEKDKGEKIAQRRELARREGITVNILHARISRIRVQLGKCIRHCLEARG
jgi:DNA-directed RNA polymerase specialized sigma24 family protein